MGALRVSQPLRFAIIHQTLCHTKVTMVRPLFYFFPVIMPPKSQLKSLVESSLNVLQINTFLMICVCSALMVFIQVKDPPPFQTV